MKRILTAFGVAIILLAPSGCASYYYTYKVEGSGKAHVTLVVGGKEIIDRETSLPYQFRTATNYGKYSLIATSKKHMTCKVFSTYTEDNTTRLMKSDAGTVKVKCSR